MAMDNKGIEYTRPTIGNVLACRDTNDSSKDERWQSSLRRSNLREILMSVAMMLISTIFPTNVFPSLSFVIGLTYTDCRGLLSVSNHFFLK